MSVSFSVKYSATPTATPGSGFSGATAQPATVGSGAGDTCTSIARWTMVPYETFTGRINVGLLAFHINEIDYVTVSVDGGAWQQIDEMTINPRTRLTEYVVALDSANHSAGPIEIRAIAYPVVGIPRVLDSLYLIAQPSGGSGRYFPVYAYVNPATTDDSTGVASATAATAANSPFKRIGPAMEAIQAARSSAFSLANCDQGIVRIVATTHAWNMAGSSVVKTLANGWITIEAVPGHDATDTIIQDAAGGGWTNCNGLRFHNITIRTSGGTSSAFLANDNDNTANTRLWYDRCVVSGGQWNPDSRPDIPTKFAQLWFTDNELHDLYHATLPCEMSRGNDIHDIGGDAHRNCPLIVGNTVDNIDPGVTGEHSDWCQFAGGFGTNVIIYANTVSNLHYQAFWIQFDNGLIEPTVENGINGLAIVGNTIDSNNDPLGAGAWSEYAKHCLWWDNRFNFNFTLSKESNGDLWLPRITDWSVTGNYFRQFIADPAHVTYVDFSLWDNNEFDIIAGDPGADTFATALIGTNASHV
jgi:hypothetical protein